MSKSIHVHSRRRGFHKRYQENASLLGLLKDCIRERDLSKGSKIHAHILRRGFLENDVYVGSALISLYSKCGVLGKAQEVFDQLPVRDVVSWTSLITGYVQCGRSKEALDCFNQMRREGLFPNSVTFLCILRACGSIGASSKGEEIHSQIIREKLLERNILLATALIDMYGKCDKVVKAQEVFDEIEDRDVISWTALIAGYAQHGHGAKALYCFEQMQHEGYMPNSVTFLAILKACGHLVAGKRGQTIHVKILKEGLLEKDVSLGNALVDMYAKCGELGRAQSVFDELLLRNIISWTSLIGGYAEHGYGKEALNCLESMKYEGFSPDAITFVCALRACGGIGAVLQGRQIHEEIDREGFFETDILVGNALVDMYAKCDALIEAQEVFEKLPFQDIVSWTVLISGYAQHGHGEEALNCFEQMQSKGLSPNKVTYLSILKACGLVGALDKGKEIHGEIEKEEFLKKDVLIGNALVDMYAQCGALARAQGVFDKLLSKNIVSWTSLISGYVHHEHSEEALNCYKRLQHDGLSPDAVTFTFLLKACGSIGAADKGEEIHADIVKEGLLKTDILVANALIDMYAKCGAFQKAEAIFDELPIRTVVSWTSLISGYAQHGHGEKALEYFDKMQHEGLSPNEVTLLCSLKACSSIGAIDKGIEMHTQIVREGLHEKYSSIANALVDMYAKCGEVEKAQAVFDELQVKDVVSWTALMTGYAQLGKDNMVIDMFKGMTEGGIIPNLVTFSVVLNAYSHSGDLELSQIFFKFMVRNYYILPTFEHYTCLVDLFARAGHFDKALLVIKEMPMFDYLPIWTSVLGACQKWGNADVGRLAFDYAMQWDDKDSALYVCMSNIYALLAQPEDANKIII